jgi:hypothetical protein
MAQVVEKGKSYARIDLRGHADLTVLNATVGDAKTRQMESYTIDENSSTPLTTYFGTKISVSHFLR